MLSLMVLGHPALRKSKIQLLVLSECASKLDLRYTPRKDNTHYRRIPLLAVVLCPAEHHNGALIEEGLERVNQE